MNKQAAIQQYFPPEVKAIRLEPVTIICGSNENIKPGEEIDWVSPFTLDESISLGL